MSDAPGLPPATALDLGAAGTVEYARDRLRQHTQDSYAGIPMPKFPEDLRVYEHLLWQDRVDTVVEIGTYHGASALWFRDRLRTLAAYGRIERAPHVISVDITQTTAREEVSAVDPGYAGEIDFVQGDICDPATVAEVLARVRPGARCLVVEDSAHVYETTAASLAGLASLVHPGGFLIVEDGVVDVDQLRIADDWPRGVLPALDDWLATDAGRDFEVRRDLELYGLTCHPRGFLQRRGAQAV